jgi:4-oxalocrotonate tautomerase
MPIINVEIRRGRSLEQHRRFAAQVTEAAIQHLDARRDRVRIRFNEFDPSEVALGGRLMSDEQEPEGAPAASQDAAE